jgi:formyl-CoA transferase
LDTAAKAKLLRTLLDGGLPDANGRFGPFGGRYIPETLVPAFERLTEAMGRPDLKTDPKFVDHASRGVNQHELDAIIADWTSTFALPDLLALLESNGVPSSRVFRAPDMLEDPQFLAREAIVTTEHPVFGPIRMQNAFPRLSRTPGAVRWPGPPLGAHTDEVLQARAGIDAAGLTELRAKGVI